MSQVTSKVEGLQALMKRVKAGGSSAAVMVTADEEQERTIPKPQAPNLMPYTKTLGLVVPAFCSFIFFVWGGGGVVV